MSESDIEAYTPNQLEMAKIKALRRIATALEGILVAADKAMRANQVDKKLYDLEREVLAQFEPPSSAYDVPDENPDSETDLGLSDEEKREVENEINKEHNPNRMPPRAMPRTPVKGKNNG